MGKKGRKNTPDQPQTEVGPFPGLLAISAASALNSMQQAVEHPQFGSNASDTSRSEASIAYVPPAKYSDKPLFFFHEDADNGIFCQWYSCRFTDPELAGLTFNCAEQYMMYHKAITFNDSVTAGQVMKAASPRDQKKLGKQISGFNDAQWDEVKSSVVQRGNYLKFTQCDNAASSMENYVEEPVPLRDLLLATGERELAEASPFDRVWGIGFRAEVALSASRSRWGQNLLGKALMHVRRQLQEEMEAGQAQEPVD